MLTADQIAELRTRIETERDVLLQRITKLEKDVTTPEEAFDSVEDRGQDAWHLLNHERAMHEIVRGRLELAQFDKALARIDAGTYGYSEVSGKPIPLERLEALPWATTLVGEHLPDV